MKSASGYLRPAREQASDPVDSPALLRPLLENVEKDLLSGPDAGNPRPIFGPETISRPGAGVVGGVISGLVDY
jgi:hypothetical protein